MRLLVTGAFVRAARSARIARSQRFIATTSSASGTSEQPKPTGNPFGASRRFEARDEARQNFGQRLRNAAPNTITQEGGLTGASISGNPFIFDSTTNLSPSILKLIDRQLYNIPNHPLCITKKFIESVFGEPTFHNHTVADPVVTTKDNFDDLGFPVDHPGRSRTDTYYVDSTNVLRTHTSAHQNAAFKHMKANHQYGYTICADVFRRDSIDRSHFPVFHQMEGARCWMLPSRSNWSSRLEAMEARIAKIEKDTDYLQVHDLQIVENAPAFDYDRNPPQLEHDEREVEVMVGHLKKSLEGLVHRVFTRATTAGVGGEEMRDKPLEVRWVEAYFPFTSPSFELEVKWQGEWLELLGCGIVQQPILNKNGLKNSVGWAWGLGIERLAMLLFGIPDIRLFWSTDERFLSQFKEGFISKYEPFSKFPACYKDVAFWTSAAPAGASPLKAQSDAGVAVAAGGDSTKAAPTETQAAAFHENDVMEIVRDVGGTLVEDVRLVDEFVHPKTGRKSLCYRINYRSLERTLTNVEVNELHSQVETKLTKELGVELR